MNDIEQAKELLKRIRAALREIGSYGRDIFTEDEVLFRYIAVEGLLIMANNDVGRMVRRWEDDEQL